MHRGFVISVGGSVMVPDRIDVPWIRRFARIVDRHHEAGMRFGLVAGGGRTARDYAWAVRLLGGTKTEMDEAGIIATHANAWTHDEFVALIAREDTREPGTLLLFT